MIMEYQKIVNLLDDGSSNQPSKFKTKDWVEVNDESRGTYNVNSQIKFKTTMLESTINFVIFWEFLMFYQIFLSPQVKRWAIITYKHGIYELPHELPNDLRLRDLRLKILGN